MQKELGEGSSHVSIVQQQEVIDTTIQAAILHGDGGNCVCRAILHGVIQANAWGRFFGEFLYNLPSRQGRTLNEVGLAKARKSRCAEDIELYGKIVAEEAFIPYLERNYVDPLFLAVKGHSERFLHHTSLSLIADVRLAIKRAGLPRKKVKKVVDKFYARKKIPAKKYRNVVVPVYLELRKMGYTDVDLR